MQPPAQGQAQQAGGQAYQHKFHQISPGDVALPQAEHAQQRSAIQMGIGKVARRQRHGYGAQQRCQQGHQVQEFLRPLQGLAHLRAAAFQGFHAQAAHACVGHVLLGPAGKTRAVLGGACHGKAVGDAAGRLHQAGGGQIGHVHQHARGKVHETRAPVGLLGQDARHLQACIAQQQRVAHAQAQGARQGGVHPYLAGGGHVGAAHLIGCAGGAGAAQLAAQGVARGHAFECHQAAGATVGFFGAGHGGKVQRLAAGQAPGLGLGSERGGRRLIAGHHHIAAQQLRRIALQACIQAIGKKRHRTQRRHRQGDGSKHQAQATGAQVTQQAAPAQGEDRNMHVLGLKGRWGKRKKL